MTVANFVVANRTGATSNNAKGSRHNVGGAAACPHTQTSRINLARVANYRKEVQKSSPMDRFRGSLLPELVRVF